MISVPITNDSDQVSINPKTWRHIYVSRKLKDAFFLSGEFEDEAFVTFFERWLNRIQLRGLSDVV